MHFFVPEIDDCINSTCLHGATCTDKLNGFYCLCSEGYTGDDCETGKTLCFHIDYEKRSFKNAFEQTDLQSSKKTNIDTAQL